MAISHHPQSIIISILKDDFDHSTLPSELEVLPVVFKSKAPANFADFVQEIRSLSREKRMLIKNVVTIIRLVLTNGATSVTPEQSFSMMRQNKNMASFDNESKAVEQSFYSSVKQVNC